MHIELTTIEQLSDTQLDAWRSLCVAHSHLSSGYFRPEFAADVAAVRRDVRVAVIRDDSLAGPAFLCFQQQGSAARPLAGRLSDYQAVIAPPAFRLDVDSLLAQCRLKQLHFDHLVDPAGAFASWTHFTDGSPYIDLSSGFEAYRQACQAEGHRELKESLRKARKLQREAGELELQFDDPGETAWESLLQWKSQQYRDARITDVFSHRWTVALLRRLAGRTGEFRGVLSSLRVQGQLAAVHFGMLCRGELHYWFPAYSRAMSQYSPGRVLLLELTRQAEHNGVRRIDLGRGMSRYKVSAMSGSNPLSVGAVDLRPLRRAAAGACGNARQWLRQSPLRRPLQLPARAAYRLREWLQYR